MHETDDIQIKDEDLRISDDIEKALWNIKKEWDIPTEEIELAVASRRKNIETEHLDKALKDTDVKEFENEIELYKTYGGD